MTEPRNTVSETPLGWLDCIQRGGTADWQRLYARCQDADVARQVASLLPLRDPDLLPSARLWRFLLTDLHPSLNLSIDLREDQHEIGV